MKRIALLLLVAPLVLAACGGSSHAQVKVDPLAYVKQSAHKTSETSAHTTMTANMNMGAMSLSMDGSGDYAYAKKLGSFGVSFSAMGQNGTVHEILDGTTIYMSSSLFSQSLPAGKTWVKVDFAALAKAQGINMSSLLSQSPSQALQRLEAAGTVNEVGTETIDGAATTHYRLTNLDASKLLPKGTSIPNLDKIKYSPIDVWIGNANGYVYRESLSLGYAAAGQQLKMTMVVNLSKFGEAVNVSAPPASETVDMSALAGVNGIGA